jgi:hypothetical protein
MQNREKQENIPEKKQDAALKHKDRQKNDDIILMSHGDGGLKRYS